MRFVLWDALRGRLLRPDHFQPLLAKINGRKINIACLDIHKLCSGCSFLFGLCIEDRKIPTGRRKETIAFQGNTRQEVRQMRLSVSWTTGLDLKTFLTACRNALGGGRNSIQKIERCFCQAGRVRFTAKGGK